MENSTSGNLKEKVREFWNRQSCDTQTAISAKFSKEYFEEIESFRYFDQPYIHSFAQFTRYRGKKVLEVGVGAGTDFIQWLRAGAIASGIDLTQEALDNLTHRIHVYDLPKPARIQVSDAENLPFDSGTFDLGYSFGVLHHTPDTKRAIQELVRVVRPGGEVKIMLYNRHSIWAFNQWMKHALLKGRPWKSLGWALWNFNESVGTKAYTRKELVKLLLDLGLRKISIRTELTSADYLGSSAFAPLNLLYRIAIRLAGERYEWRPEDYVDRIDSIPRKTPIKRPAPQTNPRFTGNKLGFYHCISAEKI